MTKVFIDGSAGTTGLQVYDRLAQRKDLELITLSEELRKDLHARQDALCSADIAFLCLPDAAAKEAVALAEGSGVKIIDTSTAHRTNPDWAYGFPELSPAHRKAIQGSTRVANPGCHATGFISMVYPLIAAGVLPKDALLSSFSLTGYSGGGKKMIAQYETEKTLPLASPGIYGVTQSHKHLPEMQKICGLTEKPVFSPIVDDYYKGMATTVPFHRSQLRGVGGVHDLWQIFADHYGTYDGKRLVWAAGDPADPEGGIGGTVYANAKAGKDSLTLIVAGHDEQMTVTALFDNLGKGASGAAIQNMNILLGLEESAGLEV